jgi:hypothetical protein
MWDFPTHASETRQVAMIKNNKGDVDDRGDDR